MTDLPDGLERHEFNRGFEADTPVPVAQPLPVGAYLASALMAAGYGGDSGEDVDRLIDELARLGYEIRPIRADWTPDDVAELDASATWVEKRR